MANPRRVRGRSTGQMQRPGMPIRGGIGEDIRALNSSILLITQKMKYLVRNEKILGRNLIVLNKKIKALEEKIVASKTEGGAEISTEEISKLNEKIASLESDLSDLRFSTATKEDVKEVKFVLDSINPLEFATLSQVRDMIDKRVEELKKRETEAKEPKK